jgi:hypothetical protein
MIKPQFSVRMFKSLGIEEWQKEDRRVADNLGTKGKIMRKDVSLEVVEALLHDALLYRDIYDANFHLEGAPCELVSVINSEPVKTQQPTILSI